MIARNKFSIVEFLKNSLSGGFLLIITTIFSLVVANSIFGNAYREFFEKHIDLSFSVIELDKSILHWINDGLMVVFFLMVGLEIKRELIIGELSSRKKAMLPLIAAIGGMIVPALIYTAFNHGGSASHGWGISMATDIAFALAILNLLGNKIPIGLKVFLVALAIIDDLGAVLVIAIFYTSDLQLNYLALSLIPISLLFFLNRRRSTPLWFYILPGIILWYFILKSGVHATIAGVLLALFIPLKKSPKNKISLLEKLEKQLHGFVNNIVLPLFALANTALLLNAEILNKLIDPLSVGIICGLFLGKPLGIFSFSFFAVKTKMASLPKAVNWKHIAGAGVLGGIGFTMAIFISILAFNEHSFQELSKVAVLFASVISAFTGVLILKKVA